MIERRAEDNLLVSRVQDASTPIFAPAPNDSSEKLYIPLNFGEEVSHSLLEEADDDLLRWYPMRLRYVKEKKALEVRAALEDRGYHTFLHIQPTDHRTWRYGEPEPLPLFKILFIQAKKIQLKLLKRFDKTCSVMQFWPKATFEPQHREILWIPNRQMENFIEAASREDPFRQRIPLTYSDFIDKQDKPVRIINGPFAGVEGEIKRIGHRRIVVSLLRDTHSALGLCDVAPSDLEFI